MARPSQSTPYWFVGEAGKAEGFDLHSEVQSLIVDAGDNDDGILGGSSYDLLFGGVGNDLIGGGGGSDTIYGDNSANPSDLSGGNDRLFGDLGNDLILAGAGADLADGGDGNDSVDGGTGNDTIVGGSGADDLRGGQGDDHLYGNARPSPSFSVPFSFTIDGTTTSDTTLPFANGIAESESGGADDGAADRLDGGDGNDVLDGGLGADTLIGGAGLDTADYSRSPTRVIVNLASSGPQAGGFADGDTLREIENIIGSNFGDTLTGTAGNNVITGGGGHDTLFGKGGSDVFRFAALGDTGTRAATADLVRDFSHAQHDHIKLSEIDANGAGAGHPHFSFIGKAAFTAHHPAQVREFFSGHDTFLALNTDNDARPEALIHLHGHLTLHAGAGGDFLL